jgi:hypothetical protein
MHTIRNALLALAATAVTLGAAAQTPREGPYVVAAVGRGDYDYDCFFLDCDNARATAGKLIAGYRFGVFALEGWWLDFGDAGTDVAGDSQRMRALGLSANWTAQFGSSVEGTVRAGVANVQRERTRYGSHRRWEPAFGLALAYLVAPTVSLELAWDTTRFYGSDQEGTTLARALTAGLRLRF